MATNIAQGPHGAPNADESARIFLQPIAAPSVLGLYGFAGATVMVGAYMAGWYGGGNATVYLFPFAAFFGGLAQFLAGMWAYRARDALATAMHGMWGSFWMSYGLLHLLFALGVVTPPTGAFPALGFWFIVLAWITVMGAWAATAVNLALFAVLAFLAGGSALAAFAEWSSAGTISVVAGYMFVASAIIAWYTASAMMLEAAFERPVLPVGKARQESKKALVGTGAGEPGVFHGQ